MKRFTREEIAARVAQDIPEGAYVNLGIGLPTKVANYLPADKEIFLHSENGVLGMGPARPRRRRRRPHQCRQAAGHAPDWRFLLPSRGFVLDDARGPPGHLRAGCLPGLVQG
jgi:3-oxoadipate CoA-transferase beta subunit